MSRRTTVKVRLPHADEITLPNGKVISRGDRFTVTTERGTFKMMHVWLPDGSVTAWGPVNQAGSQDAQWRSFPTHTIKRIIKEKS